MTKKTVKAWALVQAKDGYLPPRWSSEHSVFQPRVYSTEEGAATVANHVVTGAEKLRVVPCTISYQVAKNK